MNVNADLVARFLMRVGAEVEALTIQRDALAEENERLKAELEAMKPEEEKKEEGG